MSNLPSGRTPAPSPARQNPAPTPPPVIPIDSAWEDRLDLSGTPPHTHPAATLDNTTRALRYSPDWSGVAGYNEFSNEITMLRPAPWLERRRSNAFSPRPWTDHDDSLAAIWMQEHQIRISTPTAAEAIAVHSKNHSFNPLIDYLTSLEWDGQSRVDRFLTNYFGAQWSDYSCGVSRAWLVSAVARAFQPGCKADHCLVLEGPQGHGKSSALRTLAGEQFFSDYVSEDLASKEAAILCEGVWIVEFSELQGIMHKPSKMEDVKAFLSRSEDRYRPVYGRKIIRSPRRCVFAATTNKAVYMHDEENRRFWPLYCTRIDLAGIERDRDQLWAEACTLFYAGEPWYLQGYLEGEARKEQAIRYDYDLWQEIIRPWLRGHTDVAASEVAEKCLNIRVSEMDREGRRDKLKIVRCLTALGWEQYRIGGTGERRYRPKTRKPPR